MARRRVKSQIILDWFTVSYRSVILTVSIIVALVIGGGVYWLYFGKSGPRTEASEAIQRAADKLAEAAAYTGDERLEELRASAHAALEGARSAFQEHQYDDARVAAIQCQNRSQQLIDLARGESSGSHQVRFYRIEGDVRVKRAGEFSWESADPKMTLHIGDQVKTSSSASAQLIYFDGTVTTIEPGSLLEIRDLFEDPATRVRKVREKLNWGELMSSTQQRNVEGSYHEVATEEVAARTEEQGEFRVAYDKEDGTTTFDVFQGRVQVASPGRKESLMAGERIHAAADGKLTAKEVLPGVPRLVAPPDQRVFVHENPMEETTALSWENVPGAARYHLMISDRVLFTDPLYDAEREETSVVIEGISPGYFYWKVAALSRSGVEGPFSQARSFRVTSEKIRDQRDTTPPDLKITEFVQTGPMVIVNGRTEPGALLWVDNEKVDVYEDGTFYAVVRLRKEGVNELLFIAQDAAGNRNETRRRAYVEFW